MSYAPLTIVRTRERILVCAPLSCQQESSHVLTIARRLAEIREWRNLSARYMADELTANGYKVSDVAVLGYEKEKESDEKATQKIPGEYLAAVCRVYGVNPRWMLLGEGPRRLLEEPGAAPFRDGAAEVIAWLDGLTEMLRHHLLVGDIAIDKKIRVAETLGIAVAHVDFGPHEPATPPATARATPKQKSTGHQIRDEIGTLPAPQTEQQGRKKPVPKPHPKKPPKRGRDDRAVGE